MYKVNVGKKILSANEEYALKNSQLLTEQKKLCLNMISSPGSGKTTILARTISELKDKIKIGVIEGDIQTEIDAERWETSFARRPLNWGKPLK
ncbi:MAG: GTP-binding protein [Planctomycetota bacterium]|jgi:hydrogenase nickel incorporation protein HypB